MMCRCLIITSIKVMNQICVDVHMWSKDVRMRTLDSSDADMELSMIFFHASPTFLPTGLCETISGQLQPEIIRMKGQLYPAFTNCPLNHQTPSKFTNWHLNAINLIPTRISIYTYVAPYADWRSSLQTIVQYAFCRGLLLYIYSIVVTSNMFQHHLSASLSYK